MICCWIASKNSLELSTSRNAISTEPLRISVHTPCSATAKIHVIFIRKNLNHFQREFSVMKKGECQKCGAILKSRSAFIYHVKYDKRCGVLDRLYVCKCEWSGDTYSEGTFSTCTVEFRLRAEYHWESEMPFILTDGLFVVFSWEPWQIATNGFLHRDLRKIYTS